MSGMVYKALPMGAVPVAYDSIIDLSTVSYEEIDMGDGTACLFKATDNTNYLYLSSDDMEIMDVVIQRFGRASKS